MLNESVKQLIFEHYEKLSAEGKIFSRDKLDGFYATFRARFGLERLAKLDGQELLETMHAHGTRDSLVYWLEFKDDEEFPSGFFGGIGGGSALKYGLFRRKETGQWNTHGDSASGKPISLDEAIVLARRNREQFLRGAEEIAKLPPQASDADYRQLQSALNAVAPDVSDTSWGHKYFHLLFPDKIDDFHNQQWQRFQILKLLQEPPEGKGRYLCAGRFVAAAHEVNFPIVTLDMILNSMHGGRHRYWRIGTTNGEERRNRWPLMRDGGCVAIGWALIGDLASLKAADDSRDRLQKLLETHHPANPSVVGRTRSQIWKFLNEVAMGDLVIAADGGTVLGIGRIAGDYFFDAASDFPHRRPVQWLSLDEWNLPVTEGLQTTVHEIRADKNILEIEKRIQSGSISPAPTPPVASVQLSGVPGRIQAVLERKGQIILYGPPGTGKTHWATNAAFDLAARRNYGKPFGQLSESEKAKIVGTQSMPGFVRFCTFHSGYGYEDFIEGYRPDSASGQITFVMRDGIFKRLCKDAQESPEQHYYLIIDEINRGDIPRIFGELITVLEKDKRNRQVCLPLSQQSFVVPANVFVIATMNTADRSISLLDAALRRRFGFIELMPDPAVLKHHTVAGIPLGLWFEELNHRICQFVKRDARNLQVGHSYLLQDGQPIKDIVGLKRAIRDDIIPLLEEYCYEDFSALEAILGKRLIDVATQRIKHELFEDGGEEELVQALLEPCPELSTSSEATSSETQMEEGSDDSDEDRDET